MKMWSVSTENRTTNVHGRSCTHTSRFDPVRTSFHTLSHAGNDDNSERLFLPQGEDDHETKKSAIPNQWICFNQRHPNTSFSWGENSVDKGKNGIKVTRKEHDLLDSRKMLISTGSGGTSIQSPNRCKDSADEYDMYYPIHSTAEREYSFVSLMIDYPLVEDEFLDIVLDDVDNRDLGILFPSDADVHHPGNMTSVPINGTRPTSNDDTEVDYSRTHVTSDETTTMPETISSLHIPCGAPDFEAYHGFSTSCFVSPWCSTVPRFSPQPCTEMIPESCLVGATTRKEQDVIDDDDALVPQRDLSSDDHQVISSRFRIYQEDQWMDQFRELQKFAQQTGHTFVPSRYMAQDSLSRWTKRQRYQFKLRCDGKVSTMTDQRVALLNELGFVWNSQVAVWEQRLRELQEYKDDTGHCNVPSHYSRNQKLATWVKVGFESSFGQLTHFSTSVLTLTFYNISSSASDVSTNY